MPFAMNQQEDRFMDRIVRDGLYLYNYASMSGSIRQDAMLYAPYKWGAFSTVEDKIAWQASMLRLVILTTEITKRSEFNGIDFSIAHGLLAKMRYHYPTISEKENELALIRNPKSLLRFLRVSQIYEEYSGGGPARMLSSYTSSNGLTFKKNISAPPAPKRPLTDSERLLANLIHVVSSFRGYGDTPMPMLVPVALTNKVVQEWRPINA